MSNFAFIRADWPDVFDAAVNAEANLAIAPQIVCIMVRLAGERLTDRIYDIADLPPAAEATFHGRTNAPAFRAEAGPIIGKKFYLIRKVGNTAAHSSSPIDRRTAHHALTELFHILIWAAQRYSTHPNAVPVNTQFDPALAQRVAPLSRHQVAEELRKRDQLNEKRAKLLVETEEQLEETEEQLSAIRAETQAKDAEIIELRAQIAAAHAANPIVDRHDYREDETRTALIDVLLREAGWDPEAPNASEFEVHSMPTDTKHLTTTGYVDYVLWGPSGAPLGLVEAKRTHRSAAEGQQQARLYADALEKETGHRPVIFYSNGYETWVWDDASGYPPRRVQGFFTSDELALMTHRRGTSGSTSSTTARRVLSTETIDATIAGRPYQTRAIRAVGETFDSRHRAALLVMATGSGKTRTTIALVQQMMKANWAKRILFLADRTALVTQAGNAFKEHLPDSPLVNLLNDKKGTGRVYLSTYQTMMNLIGEQHFGPGFFDLIVIDEAHRSVYAKYGFIFTYFDALLLGLTATPKDQIDHNTYQLFDLPSGEPTDAYTLDSAVADGYLVPARGISVTTEYLRQGVRYCDLTPEQQTEWDLKDWGEETPDEISSTELNKYLFNADTVDKVLQRLMEQGHTVDAGERLAKTIIFAKNQRHAEFIAQRFDISWPHLAGNFARVITHSVDRAQTLIEEFSTPEKPPHIAISVDMLDTGIDVPEVANLVFFKEVHSETKFWQMIGRGTRLCANLYGPGKDKEDFLVFDFCGNLDYFNQEFPSPNDSIPKSLTQRITERQIAILCALQDSQQDAANDTPGKEPAQTSSERAQFRDGLSKELHAFFSGMNPNNVLVRPHRRAVERFAEADAWAGTPLSEADAEALLALTGLPSDGGIAADKNSDAKRFDVVVYEAILARLTDDAPTLVRAGERIRDVASELLTKTSIPVVQENSVLLEAVASDDWWVDVTETMLETARKALRPLYGLITKSSRNAVYTNFEDAIVDSREVSIIDTAPGLNLERFREKARSYLRDHSDNLVVQRLQRGHQLTTADLDALEEMLLDAATQTAPGIGGVSRTIEDAASTAGGLGLLIRSLVGLERTAVNDLFAHFLDESKFSTAQIHFVQTIIDELTQNGVMAPERLFEDPYRDIAPNPLVTFDPSDFTSITSLLDQVREAAIPESPTTSAL